MNATPEFIQARIRQWETVAKVAKDDLDKAAERLEYWRNQLDGATDT